VPKTEKGAKVFFAVQEYMKDISGRGTSGGNPEGRPVIANPDAG
jgi:hypothetical protein